MDAAQLEAVSARNAHADVWLGPEVVLGEELCERARIPTWTMLNFAAGAMN